MDPVEPVVGGDDLEGDTLPWYEPPRVVTYRGEQILRMLGPVHACSFGHSTVVCGPSFPGYVAPWENRPAGGR
jgi:hypothetical protein